MPTAKISIPTPLQPWVDGHARVVIEGETIAEVFEGLLESHAELRRLLLDETGAVRRHVNVFVGREQVRDPMRAEVRLEEDCEIRIVPSMAGG
jgi:molybdopterin converting factor small subunit